MRVILRAAVLASAVFVASLAHAGTPNTTAAGAVSYQVGQGWMSFAIEESAQNRWFTFVEVSGRSYCIEATTGSASYLPLDPSLTLYSDAAGTTQLSTNNDGAGEPRSNKGARICYISALAAGTAATRSAKINVPVVAASGDTGYVKARVVETTLFAPYWFHAGDGVQWSEFHFSNMTNTALTAKIVLSQSVNGGALIFPGAAYATTLPPHGGATAQTYWGFGGIVLGSNNAGAVFVVHDGPPGAVVGHTIVHGDNGAHIVQPFTPRQ